MLAAGFALFSFFIANIEAIFAVILILVPIIVLGFIMKAAYIYLNKRSVEKAATHKRHAEESADYFPKKKEKKPSDSLAYKFGRLFRDNPHKGEYINTRGY